MEDRTAALAAPDRKNASDRALSIAWFLIMLTGWSIVATLLVASPDTADRFWHWSRNLPMWQQVIEWIILLPWMVGLAIWQSDWATNVRVAAVTLVALAWIVASKP
ncbi:MAG: hypothetical protein R3C39_07300 [Dehalococcoidia bacterium]